MLFRFRTIDRLPEQPSADQLRGTLVHAVLERLFDLPPAERTPEAAAALVAPEWARLTEQEPALAELFAQDAAVSPVVAEPALLPEPAPAAQPTLLPEPAPAAQPAPTAQPALLPEPTFTPRPALLPEPAPTAQPALLPEPAPTAQPALLPEPALTAQPALLPEPAVTAEPALLSDAALTAEPALTGEPALAAQPALIAQPALVDVPDDAADEASRLAAFLAGARTLLDGYFAVEDPTRLEPAERESLISTVVDDRLLIRGYIDRLDISPAGELRVVDYKTGGAPREAFEARALFQLKFYALVLWRTRGVVPRVLRLLYLKDAEICDYHPDAEELAKFERTLVALSHAVERARRERDFRPKPSRLCGWCHHRALCPEFGGMPPPFPDIEEAGPDVGRPAAGHDLDGEDP